MIRNQSAKTVQRRKGKMYGRGPAVAAGTASALFAAVDVGTLGRIVTIIAAIVCTALTVRQVLRLRRDA
jgi:hypothetical protein